MRTEASGTKTVLEAVTFGEKRRQIEYSGDPASTRTRDLLLRRQFPTFLRPNSIRSPFYGRPVDASFIRLKTEPCGT